MYELGPGKPLLAPRYIINSFKGLTFAFLLILMTYFNNFSKSTYVYFALHGSYGVLWVVKDLVYPDKSWQQKATFLSLLVFVLGNLFFWMLPLMQVSGMGVQEFTDERLFVCIIIYSLGVFFTFAADAQKYYTLKYKQGLVKDGLFAKCRNPNYLGESLLYLAFCVCIGHWVAYLIWCIQGFILFEFLTRVKDLSLKNKKGWEEYSQKSYRRLFKIFGNDVLNYLAYTFAVFFFYFDYQCGGFINLMNLKAIEQIKPQN